MVKGNDLLVIVLGLLLVPMTTPYYINIGAGAEERIWPYLYVLFWSLPLCQSGHGRGTTCAPHFTFAPCTRLGPHDATVAPRNPRLDGRKLWTGVFLTIRRSVKVMAIQFHPV